VIIIWYNGGKKGGSFKFKHEFGPQRNSISGVYPSLKEAQIARKKYLIDNFKK